MYFLFIFDKRRYYLTEEELRYLARYLTGDISYHAYYRALRPLIRKIAEDLRVTPSHVALYLLPTAYLRREYIEVPYRGVKVRYYFRNKYIPKKKPRHRAIEFKVAFWTAEDYYINETYGKEVGDILESYLKDALEEWMLESGFSPELTSILREAEFGCELVFTDEYVEEMYLDYIEQCGFVRGTPVNKEIKQEIVEYKDFCDVVRDAIEDAIYEINRRFYK